MATITNPDAGPDDDLIIKLDDTDLTPPHVDDIPGVPTIAPAAATSKEPVEPAAGLEEISKQLTEAAEARAEAEDRARRAEASERQQRALAEEAERRNISVYELNNEGALTAAEERMTALNDKAVALMEDGKFKEAAAINLQIGRIGGEIAILESKKAWFAEQRELAKQPRQQQQPADEFEQRIQGRGEELKAFLRKHKELVRTDGSFKKVAVDAHEAALESDLTPGTTAYFDFIEKEVYGPKDPATPAAVAKPAPKVAPSPRATAAPVSRNGGGPSANGAGGDTFVVTKRMRRLAEEQGVDILEWVDGYRRAVAEHRMEPFKD